jgi:antitoxin (DNA-binding transcriptional repressor) of toxin-antitoxin stability system
MYICNAHRGTDKMTVTALLRKAKPVNVREAQAKLSRLIRSKSPSMVLSHGKPVSFLVPYEEMLDLVEMLDELKDKKLVQEIARSRAEYARGKSFPAERLFKKMGL